MRRSTSISRGDFYKGALLAGYFAFAVAGCTPGPAYHRATVPLAPAYQEAMGAQWVPASSESATLREDWWKQYHDATLNRLEAQVDAGNQTLAAATANYFAARAAMRAARAQYWPAATLAPSITQQRVAAVAIPGIKNTGFETAEYQFPLTASWEPDLWARVRKTVASSFYAAQASAAEQANVSLLAHAALAAAYFELRGVEQQQHIQQESVHAWQQEMDVTRHLYGHGLTNEEALAAVESQLKAAQAQESLLYRSRAQYLHAITVLLGESPSQLKLEPGSEDIAVPEISTGIPAELLQRRPDIAEAERMMAQANAQIGVARSAYFPNVMLSGTAGFQSLSAANWFLWPSRFWSAGPSAAETLFDAGARRANVEQYRSLYDAAVASYRQTTLTAFQQVEDQLAALHALAAARVQQQAAVEAASRALSETQTRYAAGLDSYVNVLTAQTTWLSYRQSDATLQTEQQIASVQLIEALGGGWNAAELPERKQILHANRH